MTEAPEDEGLEDTVTVTVEGGDGVTVVGTDATEMCSAPVPFAIRSAKIVAIAPIIAAAMTGHQLRSLSGGFRLCIPPPVLFLRGSPGGLVG